MIKYIFIITLGICAIYKSKCPKECDVTIEHDHLVRICKDSLIAIKDRYKAVEFLKTTQGIKRVDSVKVN